MHGRAELGGHGARTSEARRDQATDDASVMHDVTINARGIATVTWRLVTSVSTSSREFIMTGRDVVLLSRLHGRYHRVRVRVSRATLRGRGRGFPTSQCGDLPPVYLALGLHSARISRGSQPSDRGVRRAQPSRPETPRRVSMLRSNARKNPLRMAGSTHVRHHGRRC